MNVAGLDLLQHFEGFRERAYLCPAGIPTIGFGFTRGVELGDTMTLPEGMARLAVEVHRFEDEVQGAKHHRSWSGAQARGRARSVSAMRLERIAWMQPALGLKVRLVGFFWGVMHPQINHLARGFDTRSESALVRHCAQEPTSVIGLGASDVLCVDGPRHVSKIRPSIVQSVAINVIDAVERPCACHVEPSRAVCEIRLSIDRKALISGALDPTNDTWGAPSAAAFRLLARELASLWVVAEKLAQTLGGKIVSSHEALPLLIGQRPAGVSSTALASSILAHPLQALLDAYTKAGGELA